MSDLFMNKVEFHVESTSTLDSSQWRTSWGSNKSATLYFETEMM